jgi:hypothetical protein
MASIHIQILRTERVQAVFGLEKSPRLGYVKPMSWDCKEPNCVIGLP